MTVDQIRNLEPGETLWDDAVSGLHVRVDSTGQKKFYVFYRAKDGRQRRFKIGTLGESTLSDARERAKVILGRVAMGEDPKADWADAKAELTVKQLYERAWAGYWNTARFVKSDWARQVKAIYKKRIDPTFGSLKLSEVTTFRVREWHRIGAKTPYAANRALAVLGRMFKYAEECELRPFNSDPTAIVKNHAESSRKRYASEEELKRIAPLIAKHEKENPHGVAFLYLLMFSGSRPRAIERATWDQLEEFEVDGQPYGVLNFEGKSSGKTGEKERVILPPQAMRVLDRLPRLKGGTITGILMPRRLWRKIKKEAGCEDLWARDWRRTFATVGLSSGVEIDKIGSLLNHKTTQTTKVYAKLVDRTGLEAATTIANRLEGLMVQDEEKKEEAV